MKSIQFYALFTLATLLALAGCSSDRGEPEGPTGTVELPLSIVHGDSTLRFLGTIRILSATDGSVAATLVSDGASPATHTVSLLPGAYTIEVADGYTCSVDSDDPDFTGCTYLGAAPEPFSITAGTATQVILSFTFHFEEEVEVVFRTGEAILSLDAAIDDACQCASDELCVSVDGADPTCAATCATNGDCDLGQFCATSAAGHGVCLPRGHEYELTTSFSVEAGAEDRRCSVLDVGNANPIKAAQLALTASPAVYAVTVWAVDAAPGSSDCSELAQASTRRLLFSKSASENLTFPEGVGYSLAAHQSLLVEAHLVNATDAAATAEVTLGLDTLPAESFEREAGLLLVEDLGINIAAQATSTITGFHALGAVLDGGSIFRLVGHTHAWGTQVRMATAATKNGAQTVVYEPVWDPEAPPVVPLDPTIALASAGGLHLACTFHNTTGQTLTSGTSTSNERCVALVYYAGAVTEQTCLKQGSSSVCCSSGTCP